MPKVVLATSVVVGSIANLLQKEKRFHYDGYFHNNWVGFPFAISNEKWCILILSFPFLRENQFFKRKETRILSFFQEWMTWSFGYAPIENPLGVIASL